MSIRVERQSYRRKTAVLTNSSADVKLELKRLISWRACSSEHSLLFHISPLLRPKFIFSGRLEAQILLEVEKFWVARDGNQGNVSGCPEVKNRHDETKNRLRHVQVLLPHSLLSMYRYSFVITQTSPYTMR
jgi:hypothetical protein